MGMPAERTIICEDGDQVTLNRRGLRRSGSVPAGHLYVDGILDDVGTALLRDRRTLADEGVVVLATIDSERHEQLRDPQVITRGWVYAPEAEPLLAECAARVRQAVDAVLHSDDTVTADTLQRTIRRATGQFVDQRTRRPVIVPVVVET